MELRRAWCAAGSGSTAPHQILRELHLEIGRFYAQAELSDALIGLRNGIQTALVVLLAAIEARTSAGAHYRID